MTQGLQIDILERGGFDTTYSISVILYRALKFNNFLEVKYQLTSVTDFVPFTFFFMKYNVQLG